MAIIMSLRWKGFTVEQYDQAHRHVDLGNEAPAGLRLHVVGSDGESIRVTDVWDSVEDFQTYADTRLKPTFEALGFEGQPEIEIFPAHNVFTPAVEPVTA